MAQKKIQFNGTVNPALQINDKVWVAVLDTFTGITEEPLEVGYVVQKFPSEILVEVTHGNVSITPNMFLMFSKSIEVNESSVKGYYADVTFKNATKTYAELFAVSSDIVPSSK